MVTPGPKPHDFRAVATPDEVDAAMGDILSEFAGTPEEELDQLSRAHDVLRGFLQED